MRFLSLFGMIRFAKAIGDSSFRYAPFRMTGVCCDGDESGGYAAAFIPPIQKQPSFRPKGGICLIIKN
jgi:hypothetical protein